MVVVSVLELLGFDSNSNINAMDLGCFYIILVGIELAIKLSFCIIKLLGLELALVVERENEIGVGSQFEQFQHTGCHFYTIYRITIHCIVIN